LILSEISLRRKETISKIDLRESLLKTTGSRDG
jgi:hypothetical protein